ncbi:DUF4142 domain-containing protein [Mesorhizobium sp. BAC0120]|uniref:DUF4142 domain-containing protein n=1 Tax=Mesorhizobium sp. BAC0120 TaxID=3090670 RepID=UPI00298D45FF|nr:DUF4142 domain-containing protein [Mesorhizobium sp. BAC0120]MDW6023589.1 DUF4142 domain-containing protein [Mesorhizobium sp. BAC0120]
MSFVNKAAIGGMFEVQSSELALKKSKDADVRQFAEMMVTDHTKANNTLKSVAKQEHLKLPTELDHEHATMGGQCGISDPPLWLRKRVSLRVQWFTRSRSPRSRNSASRKKRGTMVGDRHF